MASKQEYLMQLQILEQEANHFGEQLKIIDQQINELEILKKDMGKLEESKESEFYSEISKGIFIKGEITNKQLLIDVGNKIYVPKSFPEIYKIVEEQIGKFDEVKIEIGKRIESINAQLDKIIRSANSAMNEEERPSKKEKGKKK